MKLRSFGSHAEELPVAVAMLMILDDQVLYLRFGLFDELQLDEILCDQRIWPWSLWARSHIY